MDPQAHVIPSDIEKPVPIMFWEPIEFVMALSLMGFGIVMNLWVFGMVSGGLVLVGSRYLKRGAKQGAMQHLLWSMGVMLDQPLKTKFPQPWMRDFIE
ncbi:hypothetical protein F6X40_10535 [Paraburkholderia sp. UCT31]|uniref:type IV conjugative transfer system protein TraL n=1 Tax=Paraburkholderia sp. UCT31 TaxID=2615209 RepID=UPI001654F245|nr:type IV conjugative transfer system protein TraL [Paraburkholderia sp. UCT31]MBC8737244.1 hypothetical protein [Paraburkholderia sp. UCT31]